MKYRLGPLDYYPEARFSEDLDFTVQPQKRIDVIKTPHKVLSNVQIDSLSASTKFSQRSNRN
jgi:predicted nucleotidyltransferase component of viral defense system